MIITSPLSRARDTAVKIAEGLGIPESKIIQDAALVERDYGHQSGMTYQQRAEYEKTHPDSSASTPPSGSGKPSIAIWKYAGNRTRSI